jgi:hypothetical protein
MTRKGGIRSHRREAGKERRNPAARADIGELESPAGNAYASGVLLFKRILDFKQATLARLRDKRKSPRYPVGPGFALRGTVNLIGSESAEKLRAAAPGSGRAWGGPLANLSHRGASLLLPPAALTARGERTTLRLVLEQHTVEVPCVVAHFRSTSSHSVCGLALEFGDFTAQKAFLQLHEAVRLGASFAPGKRSAFQRSPSGLTLEEYKADRTARLAVWRRADDRQIESFELVIGDHCLRGEADGPALEVYAKKKTGRGGKSARSAPAYGLEPGVTEEVRQLFRWVVPNLTKAVPADVRTFMQRVLSETRTPAEKSAMKSFPPPPLRKSATRPPLPTR